MHREVPCAPLPAILASHITTEPHQNQGTDIGIINQVYSDFTGYTCARVCVCVCVCVALHNFVTCVAWSNHHSNQDARWYHHHEIPGVTHL